MPTRFLTASLLLGLATACHTEQPEPTACPVAPSGPAGAGLVGRWQLVRSAGGLTGRLVTRPPRPVIDEFTADSTYQRCVDGQCAAPLRFTVRTGRSFLTGQPAPLLWRGGPAAYQLLAATDSLIISQAAADGFTEYYVRLPR